MIVLFLEFSRNWLIDQGMYAPFMVFEQLGFRAVAAIILAFLIVTLSAPKVIRWLVLQKIGDRPEFDRADLNELTKSKSNTPTMGGIMIVGSILLTVLILGDMTNRYVVLGIIVLVWMAGLGGADDWLKLTAVRRGGGSRQGLKSWEKLLFQLGLGFLVGFFVYSHGIENPAMSHMIPSLPLFRAFNPEGEPVLLPQMSALWFTMSAVLVVAGTSNAVNLTDGMDGLAGGIAAICAFAFVILCGIAGSEVFAKMVLLPHIVDSGELTVMIGAMAGACLGFLWYNCFPARVFMGDTGSLALGGLLGYVAVVIRQEFMLAIIGGVFFLEMASVVLQVGYFKMTGGKRVFRCAPIHHHFHLGGWAETQVVTRLWLMSVILAAVALALIKLR